ncbi:MAG: DUF2341 domain-containing protein [Nitrospirae bacterium]|nr:MAG: DUF2341 domain-containing protein [Nitrospirota bacterium]
MNYERGDTMARFMSAAFCDLSTALLRRGYGIRFRATALLLALLAVGLMAVPEAQAFDNRKLITLQKERVGNAGMLATTITDYPFLYSVTDAALITFPTGKVRSVNGYDIIFRAFDADNPGANICGLDVNLLPVEDCTLDHEIEKYVATSGELVAWVRIPVLNTISASSNTKIYIYYGDSGVSASTENAAGVWNSSVFKGVWHLKETSGTVSDSTTNANTGTNNGATLGVAGKMGNATDFNGSTNYINVPYAASLDAPGAITLEAWMRKDAASPGQSYATIINKLSGSNPGYALDFDSPGTSFGVETYNGSIDTYWGPGQFDEVTWHHVVGVWSPKVGAVPGVYSIYIDGVEYPKASGSANTSIGTWNQPLNIGGRAGSQGFNGALDEVRVSSVARDQHWIKTEFNNMGGPGMIGAPNWSAVPNSGPNNSVYAVAVYNGQLYVGGAFTSVTGPGGTCNRLCRFDASTNTWSAVGTWTATTPSAFSAGDVQFLTVYNGKLYVGGAFQNGGGINICDYLCRWDGSAWSAVGAWNTGSVSTVYALAEYNGQLYVGGAFTKANNIANCKFICRWNDTAWSAPSTSLPQSTVYVLAVYNGLLYAGGAFSSIGAFTNCNRLCRYNGTAWSDTGSIPFSGGNVVSLAVYNGQLYVGGNMTSAAGLNTGLDRFNGTTWSTVGGFATTGSLLVNALAVYCGELYVGGSFTNFNGVIDYLARWNDSAWNNVSSDTAVNDIVNALAAYQGRLYVGGQFTIAGVAATAIATWSGECFYTVGTEQPNAPSLARVTQAHALSHDGASTRVVELHWRTSYEVDHLGFHVYREEQGQRVRITPALIAGSSLKARAGTVLTAGQSYSWWDVLPQSGAPPRYWLEEIDLKGQRTWHGPVEVKSAKGHRLASESERVRSVLLTRLGRNKASVTAAPWYGARQAALASPTQESLAVQWRLAASPAVKLGVQAEGWYRVSQPELVAAGLDPRVDPRLLQLYADGVEVPLLVTGEQDGRFGPSDAIEFYGLGLDTPWTDTRTYWLVAGSQAGKRVSWAPGRQAGALAPLSFPSTLDWRPRILYFAALLNGEADNFFGPIVSTEPVDQDFTLAHLDPSPPGEGRLEVVLQGVTDGLHQVEVQLNGSSVGTVTFEGMHQGTTTVRVSPAVFLPGANRVTLVALGGEMDYSLVASVRLTYWRFYQADGDVLEAAVQGGNQVTITGFSGPQIRVVDVTEPDAPQLVPGRVKREQSGFAVTVVAPGSGNRTLLAFVEGTQARLASVRLNQPSQWHERGNGADLVILTHASLLPSLASLQAWRQQQGWAVALIDVENLYDEFSFGAKSPWALRAFLQQAHSHWARPPRFLLLAGDASFDPRNFMGMGEMDVVPTKLVDTHYLETASDDWFGDLDGDGVPEIAVGRLAVQTSEQAAAVVQKLIAYDRAGAGGHAAVLVADHDDGIDFEGASGQVKALLPAGATVEEIYRGQMGDEAAHEAVLASLQRGAWLLNYVGHGSVEVWLGGVLSSEDVRTLTTTGRLPFVVAMTCLNGLFHDVFTESLAETLQKDPQGGAIAVWASSALTEPAAQAPMNQALVRKLGEGLTLGEATAQAKAAASDRDVRRSWILFGDPTTRLK